MPSAATTRRFEFSEGNSNKFWSIGQAGCDVTVRFGRIGTQGQSQTKSFPDENSAGKHVENLVQEKLAKGYREVK